MDIFVKNVILFYRFFEYGSLFLIAIDSWKFQQRVRILFMLWNVLQLWNQFQAFSLFFANWLWVFEQLFRVSMNRVSLSLCMWNHLSQERAHGSMNLWFEYLIFNHEISIFFSMKLCQFWKILSCWLMHEIFSIFGVYLLHKNIWKPLFDIFLQLKLIKWINKNKNSIN